METLKAQSRTGKAGTSRRQGFVPAVLYGPKQEAKSVQVDAKQLGAAYQQVGESSLISLDLEGEQAPVLIHGVQRDPVSGIFMHVDFYQPPLDQKIEVTVPLEFEGEAPAVKELGGTLIRNMHEVTVRALPQNLPHEIVVQIDSLKTFEDRIEIKDLVQSADLELMHEPEDLVAQVVPPENIEEELAEPVEENVEAVGQAGEKKEKEEEETAEEK